MIKLKYKLFVLIFAMLVSSVYAQEDEEIILQTYTPAVLFHKGEFELKIFNNLYTQTAYFDDGSNEM